MAWIHKIFLLASVFLGAWTLTACDITNLGRISVNGDWLVDQSGRIRLFHGFNSVKKQPPWYDQQILNTTRLKYFQEWGFNAVRLGTMWAGVEPSKGQYNQTYIDVLKAATDLLQKYGIYSLLDMHQDQMSSAFNSYDGVPRWLIDSFDPPKHAFPWPFTKVAPGSALIYLTEACSKAFQDLYDGEKDAVVSWQNFWKTIAKNFKDFDSVLGYELINEPWAGNLYTHPTILLPGNAGSKNLLPVYDKLNAAIREVDNRTLLFYEPVTWGVWLNGTTMGTGFSRVPGGTAYNNLSVLSWHYYCWILTPPEWTHPYPVFERIICDDLLGKNIFKNAISEARRIGGAAFLTEFSNCEPNKFPNSTSNVQCAFTLQKADEYLHSWMYWDTEIYFNSAGHVNWTAVTPFVRPYARAIAGIPQKMQFRPSDLYFQFDYTPDMSIPAPTEIFIPKLRYPKGVNVKVTAGLVFTFDKRVQTLLVTAKTAMPTASVIVTPVK